MIFIAILAGVCIVVSRAINAKLGTIIGLLQSTIFNFIVGLIFSIVFLLFSSEAANIFRIGFISVPWWAYLGGVVGVFVVALSSYITPRISAFYLTILIFISQLLVGLIIDYLTLNIFSIGKVIGGLLVFIGLTYNLLLDRGVSKNTMYESLEQKTHL